MTSNSKLFWLTLLVAGVLALAVRGQDLVTFWTDARYQRNEPVNPPWWVTNNLQPSMLYSNGICISQESGTNDLALWQAWLIQSNGCKVGVIDMTTHGDRVVSLVHNVSPNSEIYRHELHRWDPSEVAAGIMDCATNGCQVATVTMGWASPDINLLAAIQCAGNMVICCSTPDQPQNLDTAPDYPYSFYESNVLGVSGTDRNGQPYWSGTGTNSIGAPSRNIVALSGGVETYSSGTSWACPVAAGCIALLVQQFPGQALETYIKALRSTSVENRIAPVAALSLCVPASVQLGIE